MKGWRLIRAVCVAWAILGGEVGTARADVVWSGPVAINIPSDSAGLFLNVVTGVSGSSSGAVPGWDINLLGATALELFSNGSMAYVGSGSEYFNLPHATLISAASTFATPGVAMNSPTMPLNLNSATNVIGFSFLNEGTGQTNYGWLRVALSSTAGAQPRLILEYCYENAGAPLFAGGIPPPPVPEPSIGLLLALGVASAFALGLRRRRKFVAVRLPQSR